MSQTSRLTVEIDSRDAEQKAADFKKALEAMESAGLSIRPALDRASSGMDGLAKSSDKAADSMEDQREQISQLLGSIDPLTRKMNELEKQELALARARKSGKIDLDTFNEYQGKLNATRSALSGLDSDLSRTGMTAKATAAALRGVPAQFTDIAVSLQGGQAPLTVFLQQGGQLKDMFGGVAPAAKALSGYIIGLVNPFTVAAAAAAALGLAYYKGSEEADAYRASLLSTGNAAGSSVGEMSALAESISSVTGTTSGAATALAQIAGSGKIAAGSFETVAVAAVSFQKATGQAVSETVAEFARLGDDPVKAVASLNDKYNFLTASVYEQVRAAQEMGEKEAAAAIAQEAFAKALTDRAAKAKQDLGYIESAWNAVRSAASRAWDAMLDIGREDSLEQKITDLQSNIARREKNGFTVKPYLDQLDALQKQLALRNANAKAEADTARVQREGQVAYEGVQKSIESNYTKRQKMNKALEDEEKRIAAARAAGYSITKEEEAAALKAIRENTIYKEAASKKEKAYTEAAGIRALDQAKQQYAVLQKQSALIDDQSGQTVKLGSAAQALIKWEQELSDIKEKKTLTADQKSLLANQQLITAQLKRNAGLEKENELTKTRLENAAKLLSFQDQLNDSLQSEQQGLDTQIAGLGSGKKLQERIREDLKIRQDYQKQLARLQRDYQRIVNPTTEQTDLYEKETRAVKDALSKRLAAQEDYYRKLDIAQSNWALGANDAWNDYINEASDISGQTYDLFSNAFGGMEDALVDFVTSGKLSFKSLADSIIADIARILIRAKIVTPALNALLGGSGSGGVSGLLGSGGSGGGALNLQSAWDGISSAYSIGTSGFGQTVSAGWTAGEGFIGGIQGAFKAGAASLSSGVGSLFASSSGAMVNGVYQLGTSAAPATVDLISNTVTNSSTGAVTGTATGATTAAGTGLSAASAVMAGIGGAIQGYLKAGVKGAIAGAGGAVAGAYAGAAIGSVVPVIGTAIGGAIGAVVGGLFGSSLFGGDWVTKDQGFQLGVEGGDLESYAFKYQKKKGGLFSSNKKRTRLSALDPEMQAALDQTYAATLGSVVGLFDSLNVELNDGVLDGLNIAKTKISTKGKTAEEIQEEIAKWFTSLGDAAVAEVNKVTGSGLDGFNLEGLTTFVNNLYSVNSSLDMIGVKMVDFSVAGGRVVESLVALSGGIEALNSNITKFYDGFTSDLQKSIDTLAGVRAQFKALGLVLPETREAFADAVKGLDMTSEAERQIFVSMTANAEQAAAAYAILEQRESSFYSSFYTEAENAARVLAETTEQLRAMGVTLPRSRSEYRKLVEEASKATTESGKAMYDTLMSAASAASTVFDELERRMNQSVAGALEGVQRAVSAQRDAVTKAYSARTSSLNDMLSTAQRSVTDLTGVSSSLEGALKSLRGTSDDAIKMLRSQAKATLESALSAAKAGGALSGIDGLSDALDVISNNSTSRYASLEDFLREQGRSTNLISQLEEINGKQLTNAEKTVKALESQLETTQKMYDAEIAALDNQLALAQSQVDAINGVDNSVKSVADAVLAMSNAVLASLSIQAPGAAAANTYDNNAAIVKAVYRSVLGRDAEAKGLADWTGALSGGLVTYESLIESIIREARANGEKTVRVPGFASGGDFGGGIRLVGERGPELELTGPSRIFNAKKTAEMLSGPGGSAANEIRALREEMKAALFAIAKNTLKAAKNTDLLPRKLEEELFA